MVWRLSERPISALNRPKVGCKMLCNGRKSYFIQFAVLCAARCLSQPIKPPWPHWHHSPTFEHQLPAQFCVSDAAIVIKSSEMMYKQVALLKADEGWPELVCRFCERIKAFKTFDNYWIYVIHKHSKLPKEDLLAEIIRFGAVWYRFSTYRDA